LSLRIRYCSTLSGICLRDGCRDVGVAAALYDGVFLCMGVAFGVLFWWSIKREHLKAALPPGAVPAAVIRFGIGNVAYLAAIGIAFLSPSTALLISGLVAIYYMFEQTPGRGGPASQAGGTGAGQDTGRSQDLDRKSVV